MDLLVVAGVDITHARLVDLTRLANQAKPFYMWVETVFQNVMERSESLNSLLLNGTPDEIHSGIFACYQASDSPNIPLLFDGVGRTYTHGKACYYFFSWLIRDAPQQRLAPLIQRIIKTTGQPRSEIEIDVLTTLICQYRSDVQTFLWEAVREVIIDRLEGSRRSIRGHENEVIVRTAFAEAVQAYFNQHKGYGIYTGVNVADKQISINNETYDVSMQLVDQHGEVVRRILIAIKTRETEGGGHAHLFSRDIMAAVHTIRSESPADYIVLVIIARNWSQREIDNLRHLLDHLVELEVSPNHFVSFDIT